MTFSPHGPCLFHNARVKSSSEFCKNHKSQVKNHHTLHFELIWLKKMHFSIWKLNTTKKIRIAAVLNDIRFDFRFSIHFQSTSGRLPVYRFSFAGWLIFIIKCKREDKCISKSFLCNGYENCDGGDDEENCINQCEVPRYTTATDEPQTLISRNYPGVWLGKILGGEKNPEHIII